MNLKKLFYVIILIEGYVVLSTELLAIRQLIPFVGTGVDTVSIIIAAVLMPLAIGYYSGGQYKTHKVKGVTVTVREKLIRNFINAAIVLAFGLSYAFLELLFLLFESIGIEHRILQTFVYAAIFLVYPIYLLGQTVPLISNYFSSQKLSEATGKILFGSTIGSFFGSIITTLVLMSMIGVHNTVIIDIFLMVAVVFFLSKKIVGANNVLMLIIAMIAIGLNNDDTIKALNIVEDNNYSTIHVLPHPTRNDVRILSINRAPSSTYGENPEDVAEYITHVFDRFIASDKEEKDPMSILVIGAGGFTLGIDDDKNDYTFVDIDSSLKQVSEDYFLKRKLGDNKKFVVEPARAFLRRNSKKYDFIFVDVYSNGMTIPSQLITKEFFTQIKNSVSDGGVFSFNAVASPEFATDFSVKLDNTLRLVFPNLNRRTIQKKSTWVSDPPLANIIYSYYKRKPLADIYTDNKNTFFIDR